MRARHLLPLALFTAALACSSTNPRDGADSGVTQRDSSHDQLDGTTPHDAAHAVAKDARGKAIDAGARDAPAMDAPPGNDSPTKDAHVEDVEARAREAQAKDGRLSADAAKDAEAADAATADGGNCGPTATSEQCAACCDHAFHEGASVFLQALASCTCAPGDPCESVCESSICAGSFAQDGSECAACSPDDAGTCVSGANMACEGSAAPGQVFRA
jgi:hypothetical protein